MTTTIAAIMAQELAPQERSKALNALGQELQASDDLDGAIACWEQSMACYGKPGPAQANLMKAYNQKRRACSQAGDGAGMEQYAQKIDGLMQQSKDAIRYGF